MSIIDKAKSLIVSRKCPVLIIHSEREIEWKDGIVIEENHLKDNWNDVAWEKQAPPVIMRKDGKPEIGYVVHPGGMTCRLKKGSTELKTICIGSTVCLSEDIHIHPWKIDRNGKIIDEIDETKEIKINFEGALGKATSADIIEKGLDLVGSNKKILIGIVIGMILWAAVLGPILEKVLS